MVSHCYHATMAVREIFHPQQISSRNKVLSPGTYYRAIEKIDIIVVVLSEPQKQLVSRRSVPRYKT